MISANCIVLIRACHNRRCYQQMVAERRSAPCHDAVNLRLLRSLLGILLLSSIGQSLAPTVHAEDQESEAAEDNEEASPYLVGGRAKIWLADGVSIRNRTKRLMARARDDSDQQLHADFPERDGSIVWEDNLYSQRELSSNNIMSGEIRLERLLEQGLVENMNTLITELESQFVQ